MLDEQPVTMSVPAALAERLLVQAKALGVRCRLEPPPPGKAARLKKDKVLVIKTSGVLNIVPFLFRLLVDKCHSFASNPAGGPATG